MRTPKKAADVGEDGSSGDDDTPNKKVKTTVDDVEDGTDPKSEE